MGAKNTVSAQLHDAFGRPVAVPVAVAPHRVKGDLRVDLMQIVPFLRAIAQKEDRRRFRLLLQHLLRRGKRPVAIAANDDLHPVGTPFTPAAYRWEERHPARFPHLLTKGILSYL